MFVFVFVLRIFAFLPSGGENTWGTAWHYNAKKGTTVESCGVLGDTDALQNDVTTERQSLGTFARRFLILSLVCLIYVSLHINTVLDNNILPQDAELMEAPQLSLP